MPAPEPAVVSGVCARGAVACSLAQRILADSNLQVSLSGVAGPSLLVVTGAAESLPWVDGVTYLGCHPGTTALWWPTSLVPSVAPALVEKALRSRFGRGPLAWVPSPWTVVSLADARPIDAGVLRAWLEGNL